MSELFTYRKLRRDELPQASPVPATPNPFKLGLGRKAREASSTPAPIASPAVTIYAGRMDSFIGDGPGSGNWHRLDAEDVAKMHTGFDHHSHEPKVGIFTLDRPNGRVKVGADIWKLGVNFTPAVLARLEECWQTEAATLSKAVLRSVGRKVHISKSFVTIVTTPERLDFWKNELQAVLSDPHSFESIERRSISAASHVTQPSNTTVE